MTVFNRPGIIDEAAEASLARKRLIFKKARKPGIFIIFEIIMYGAVLYIGMLGFDLLVDIMCDILYWAFERDHNADIFLGLGVDNFDQISSLLFTISSTAAFILYARLVQGRKLRTIGFTRRNAFKHYLFGLLIGAGMFTASLLICVLTGTVKITMAESFNVRALIMLFIGYMVQGNSEEVICRGHMLVSASRRYHVALGVILNSVIFAALHLANPGIGVLPLINLLLFGLAMSLLFLRTGNIWMVSAIHTSWNFVQGNVFGVLVSGVGSGDSILVSVSDASGSLINGGDFGLEGGIAVTIVYVISIVVLLFIKPCNET